MMAQAAGLTDHLELLGAYAAGAASPGATLLVAAHLTLRPESRKIVRAMEEFGGALLRASDAETPPSPASAARLAALMDRLDDDAPADPAVGAPGRTQSGTDPRRAPPCRPPSASPPTSSAPSPIPAPVLAAVGAGFDAIPWRRRLGGLHEHVLPSFKDERVSLLRARPGVRIPHHTHSGAEITLVLSGALKDDGVEMTAGDMSLCGPEDDHHPEIIGDETCYCLVVVEGALRFRAGFGKAFRRS